MLTLTMNPYKSITQTETIQQFFFRFKQNLCFQNAAQVFTLDWEMLTLKGCLTSFIDEIINQEIICNLINNPLNDQLQSELAIHFEQTFSFETTL